MTETEKNGNKPYIMVDSKEKNYQIISLLRTYEIPMKEGKTPVGDYVIYTPNGDILYAIELKIGNDFYSSVFDGRLRNQLFELANYPESCVIYVDEGTNIKNENNAETETLTPVHYGRLFASLQLKAPLNDGRKIPFIRVQTVAQAADIIAYIHKLCVKYMEGNRLAFSFTKSYRDALPLYKAEMKSIQKSAGENEEWQLTEKDMKNAVHIAMVAQIPSIGFKTAKKIIDTFSWNFLVNEATENDLASIKGIGKKTAAKIIDYING